jgi:predicted RNase H-like nuclease
VPQEDLEMVVGVDGCTNGWVAIALERGETTADLFPDIAALAAHHGQASLILIDIPIGLRDAGREPRLCDTRARQLLGSPRCSSVFPVPLRPALRAPDRTQADLLNRDAGGAGIACQTFAISDKIAEVDAFLLAARQSCHPPIRECHPELCFWALNGGQAMHHRKKIQVGNDERRDVLRHYLPHLDSQLPALEAQLLHARQEINLARRPELKLRFQRDDLLDALVTAVTAKLCLEHGPIPPPPETDARGLPMEMVYWCPQVGRL